MSIELRRRLLGAGMALLAWAAAGPARAEMLIDPAASCRAVLAQDHEDFQIAQVAWAAGYLAAKSGKPGRVDERRFDALLRDLAATCAADAGRSFLAVVDTLGLRATAAALLAQMAGATEAKEAAEGAGRFPPTAAGAEALLRQFLAPDADHAALTASLAPDGADYRAVYTDSLATALERRYGPMWQSPPPIRPRPGQTDLLLVFATTDALIAGGPELREFPGGYGKVRDRMKAGVPIVRFKFIRPGENRGLAFDGLVYVNGRWVLIPKPWRALD